jgi:carbonic anhydrase
LKGFDNETYDIKHELDALKPMITEHINNLSFDELHAHTIEKNLDYQVSIACKKYKNLIVDGKLTVIGAFYDFREEFRKGTGTIVIVNINKHKDLNEIRQHPAFEKLTSEQINTHIARLAV